MSSPADKLDRVFNPKVIAVVGAKKINDYNWLRAHGPFQQAEGRTGKVYHVNIDESEWPGAEELGFENVKSIQDIPEDIDYVCISVPNTVVPIILRDCAAKQVAGAHIFAAGFAEMHTEQGNQLEQAVYDIATEAGIALVGPNCMGLYMPEIGIRPSKDMPYTGTPGYFGYMSQSGTTTMSIGSAAPHHGIDVSKGISFGNGTVLDSTDYLRYLADDDQTEMIGMYLEGMKDGQEFFETLRYTTQKKPVLIWKVGQSDEAARAGMAHTGSAAIPADLWNAVLTISGAIGVKSLEEMLDTAMLLRRLPPTGRNTALITVSGGHSGKIAEVFGSEGFHIPSPSSDSLAAIEEYSSRVGGSFSNPFEGPSVRGEEATLKTLEILAQDDNFDLIVVEISAGSADRDAAFVENRIKTLETLTSKFSKPVLLTVTSDIPFSENTDKIGIARKFLDAGFPAIVEMEAAARALSNAAGYWSKQTIF
jgi:acyl-CoA synthetase (NDP forming)